MIKVQHRGCVKSLICHVLHVPLAWFLLCVKQEKGMHFQAATHQYLASKWYLVYVVGFRVYHMVSNADFPTTA